MADLLTFLKEPVTDTGMYPCPACHETISIRATSCRFCHRPIDARTAHKQLKESDRVRNAIAKANTFRLTLWLAILAAIIVGAYWFMDNRADALHLIGPGAAVAYGLSWLHRYRSLNPSDSDYRPAVAKVKLTTLAWAAVLFLGVSRILWW